MEPRRSLAKKKARRKATTSGEKCKVKKVKCSKYGMESFLLSPGAKRNAEKKKKINNCFQLLLAEIKDRSSAENRQIGRNRKRITSNCLKTNLKGK